MCCILYYITRVRKEAFRTSLIKVCLPILHPKKAISFQPLFSLDQVSVISIVKVSVCTGVGKLTYSHVDPSASLCPDFRQFVPKESATSLFFPAPSYKILYFLCMSFKANSKSLPTSALCRNPIFVMATTESQWIFIHAPISWVEPHSRSVPSKAFMHGWSPSTSDEAVQLNPIKNSWSSEEHPLS